MAYESESWNYLSTINRLIIEQVEDVSEVENNYKSGNQFKIRNNDGEAVYYAAENSSWLSRYYCGGLRPFDLIIFDEQQNEMIHLYRPLACDSCCFPYCLQSMEVSAPPDVLIGTIQQEWNILKPLFSIRGTSGDKMLIIRGPICTTQIFDHVNFKVFTADGKTQIGKISKHWYGLAQDNFTHLNYFGVSFPTDLEVKMKAVMLGACFLIYTIFYETRCRNLCSPTQI